MNFEQKNGYLQGADRLLNGPLVQGGGTTPLAGLMGANKLRGGVALNADGTVASMAPVAPAHHILDAIFNHGNAMKMSQEQNAQMQQRALATTQGITTGNAQTQNAAFLQAQHAEQLQKQAMQQALIEYGKANNITVLRPDGTLTDAGVAAQSTLDPKRVQAMAANLERQQSIAASPEVQAAEKAGTIAQANAPAVDNAAKSRMTVNEGGTGVQFDPLNPTTPVDTVTGGSPHASSVSSPVIRNVGGYPMNVGQSVNSQSGVTAGGVQSMAIPDDIKSMIGPMSDVGASAAEQEQVDYQNNNNVPVQPSTASTAKPIDWVGGIGGAAKAIGDALKSSPKPQADLATANQLIGAGGQIALNPNQAGNPSVTGGYPVMSGGDQSLNPAASQPFASQQDTNSNPTLQQILQLLKSGASNAGAGLNYLTRGYN